MSERREVGQAGTRLRVGPEPGLGHAGTQELLFLGVPLIENRAGPSSGPSPRRRRSGSRPGTATGTGSGPWRCPRSSAACGGTPRTRRGASKPRAARSPQPSRSRMHRSISQSQKTSIVRPCASSSAQPGRTRADSPGAGGGVPSSTGQCRERTADQLARPRKALGEMLREGVGAHAVRRLILPVHYLPIGTCRRPAARSRATWATSACRPRRTCPPSRNPHRGAAEPLRPWPRCPRARTPSRRAWRTARA